MSTVIFESEKAAFKFDLQDVSSSLQEDDSLGHHKDAVELAMFLELSAEQTIDIPKDKQFFKFVALDLLEKGRDQFSVSAAKKVIQLQKSNATLLDPEKVRCG